jgi:hypothetical protein
MMRASQRVKTALLSHVPAESKLPPTEVEPIELAMEFYFDFLSTLEFEHRLLNVGIVLGSFW